MHAPRSDSNAAQDAFDARDSLIRELRQRVEELERECALARANCADKAQFLFDTMVQGVVYQDAAGRIIAMNPAAERILGKSPQDFLGQTSADTEGDTVQEDGTPFPGEQHPAMVALRTGERVDAVVMGVFNPRERARRWIRIHAVPAFLPGASSPHEVYTVFDDITGSLEAGEQLRASEQRYRALFDSMTEGVGLHEVICDADGEPCDYRFLDVNPAFEQLTGLRREDVVGRLKTEVLPSDDAHWIATYGKVALTGEPVQFDARSAALGRHYLVHAYRPAPMQFATVFVDISERIRMQQELERSERLYRAIGESIDYGVWVCEPDGRNRYASESFLKLVGQTQQQCSDFGWGDVLHPDDAAQTVEAWKECVRTEGVWDIEHRYRGVDGQWHPILARGVPVRDEHGNVTCWAGINLDIARLKQAEADLQRTVQEMQQTQDALRKSEAELKRADHNKTAFLAMLSHELRNPLAPIRNSLEVITRAGPASEQAGRCWPVLQRQVGQLARIVDDLLEVTRVTQNRIELRPAHVDLREVLGAAVQDHASLLAQKGVRTELRVPAEPVWVHADRERISQVLGNLLSNAAKSTGRGGLVTVEAGVDGGAAWLRVTDTGVGIQAELLPMLFEPFVQATMPLDRSAGGLGLGLSVVKSLIELHGGSVSAHSDGPGRGASFVAQLPTAQGAAAPAPTRPEPGVRRRRILIIEDNVDAAESLGELLALEGHEVALAHRGEAGIERASQFRPEVVLCDIGLPGIDGYQVARRLRSGPVTCQAKLVALSGYALPDDIRRSREAGFDAHLAKPPDIAKLLELLDASASST